MSNRIQLPSHSNRISNGALQPNWTDLSHQIQRRQMYSLYVNNFDRARERLTSLERDNLSFAAFLTACERQKPCRGLRLRDFLILPVQVPPTAWRSIETPFCRPVRCVCSLVRVFMLLLLVYRTYPARAWIEWQRFAHHSRTSTAYSSKTNRNPRCRCVGVCSKVRVKYPTINVADV